MIKVEEFILRRSRLIESLEDNSILLVFAGNPKISSADEYYEFITNRNFLYLTNIYQENSVLMIKKNEGYVSESLFIHEKDERIEKWIGKRLTIEEAKNLSGIENVYLLNQFEPELYSSLDSKAYKIVYLDLSEELKIKNEVSTRKFKEDLVSKYKKIDVIDVFNKIIPLRMVKSEGEIEEFKEAIKKTDIGLKAVMKALKPGLYEYQLQALFEYTLRDIDNSHVSFPTITSSGVNATCLHYVEAKDKVGENDLVLFDLGSQHNSYCADISRTYPANGKFNDLQKTIYEIVLGCNKMIEANAKSGVTINQLNNMTIEYLADGCLKAGLIKDKEEIKKYYFHGISHHIGLDTHDPAYKEGVQAYRDIPLVKGNVISNEPGLYFEELKIGVRIEDDLLIQDDGCINLSKDIIKEVKDIEEALKRR